MKTPSRTFGFAFAFIISALSVFAQPATTNKPVETLAEFQARLKTVAMHPRFSAGLLGIKVESLDTGKIIFEQNAEKLMKPASNAKMYSGALALDRLGPDYKIKTSFYAESKPNAAGAISGDLIVYGRGDPSFSARFNHEDYKKPIEQLAEAVTAAGVKTISGDLVGDESFFKGPPYGVGWSWDDLQEYYGAEVSALTLQENTVDMVIKPGAKIGEPCQIITKPETTYLNFINRTETVAKDGKRSVDIYRPVAENTVYVRGALPMGESINDAAVAVHKPAMWFVTLLKEALAKRGVVVSGKLRSVNWLDREVDPIDFGKLTEVAFIESRPMAEIVKGMMKPSQNLFAHLLLLQVGEKTRTAENAKENSDDAGLDEMKKFLTEVGVKKGDVLLEEGSGLSRGCLLKPSASVELLKFMHKHRCKDAFYDSLPIAGVDGTLRSRFKGTAAEKNIHAKTGTIRYVNSISGYVTSKAGEHLVFSIMLNAYNGTDGRTHTDGIAGMLADLAERTDK